MPLVTTDIVMTNGARAVMCEHAAASWPPLAALAKSRGYGTLRIYQAYGYAAASGGTHSNGTALDVNTMATGFAVMAREAGWSATWPRGVRYGQAFMDHTHLVSRCPCNPNSASYQTTAVMAGRDGLGKDKAGRVGWGGPDYIARPSAWRNWQAGTAWAEAELAKDQPPPPPPEDEDPTVFLASTPESDGTSPDQGGNKVCLVVPGKVIWLSPDELGLWLRVLPESMTAFRGSPFYWSQLEGMAADMAAGLPDMRGSVARSVVAQVVFPKGGGGASHEDIEGLLS